VLRANLKWSLVSRSIGWCLALTLAIGMTSCDALPEQMNPSSRTISDPPATTASTNNNLVLTGSQDGPLSEVNTPASISGLAPSLAKLQPQVQIVSPTADEVLTDDRVTVKFRVTDLPLFKHPELGLGNHLHVILDDKTVRGVADLDRPLVFENLAAGTHTLRVFAARPWHESFKNAGAFDLVTFHVLTKTATNNPDPHQPLLTYSRPAGTYGAEPILLDYYLTNAPAQTDKPVSSERVPNWRIRATVNDQQFILDRWAPVYLKGFKPGKNWVRLELIDDRGNPIPNVYNDNLRIVTYDPQAKDALAQLIRGELSPALAQTLVDPNYVASKPLSVQTVPATPNPDRNPSPSATAPAKIPEPIAPSPIAPSPIASVPPLAKPSPSPTPLPVAPAVAPNSAPTVQQPIVAAPSPAPTISPPPVAVAQPMPSPVPTPVATPSPTLVPAPQPIASASRPSPTATEPSPAPIQTNPTPAPVVIVPISPPSAVTVTKSPPVLPQQSETANLPNPDPVRVTIDKPGLSSAVAPSITPPSNPPAPIATMPPPGKIADKQVTSPRDRVEPFSQPQMTAPSLSQPDRTASLPSVTTPTVTTPPTNMPPQVQNPAEPTWQQQSIELLKMAKAKIRAFTNTIPAKSQRFSKNVQIWAGYARDYATKRIQAWQEQH
jgi:hypothetical protein